MANGKYIKDGKVSMGKKIGRAAFVILLVIFLLLGAVFAFVWSKLNMLNFDDGSLGEYTEPADAFVSTEEGKKLFNIVLDSEEVIDLNKITEASRIINKIMDNHEEVLGDIDELDIYSKEKGEISDER